MDLAAYRVNAPYSMDLPGLEQKAQRAKTVDFDLQKMPGEVALANAKNANDTNREGDLASYRSRVMADDPNALDALKGQPDKFKALVDAFDGMEPDEYAEAERYSTAMGEAARKISSFEAGSPEQQNSWDEELGKLYKGGFIAKTDHDHWVTQGPSPELINEAMEVDDFVKSGYKGKNSRLEEARIREIDARIARGDDDLDRKNRKTDADIAKGEGDPELRKAKLDKLKAEIDKLNRANKDKTNSASYSAARSKAAEAILKMEGNASTVPVDATQEQVDASEALIAEKAERILELYGVSGRSSIQNQDEGQTTAQPIPKPIANAGPPPIAERVVGQPYTNPSGKKAIWTGKGWQPVE